MPTNPSEILEAQVDATVRRVRADTKQRAAVGWAFVKLTILDEYVALGPAPGEIALRALARQMLGASESAVVYLRGDFAAVWVAAGEPEGDPEFPEPIVMGDKLTWAFIPKSLLDLKMPIATVASELDYVKLALDAFDMDAITPTRVSETHVAVWLHDEVDPTEEPTWP